MLYFMSSNNVQAKVYQQDLPVYLVNIYLHSNIFSTRMSSSSAA